MIIYSDSGDVRLDWDVDESTGIAEKFKVYLNFEETIYEQEEDCEDNFQKQFVLTTSTPSINITNVQPFLKYSARITAENPYGISDRSNKVLFNTGPSIASPPRHPSISFIPDSDNFKISAILNWSAPCKLNGLFSIYTISLQGSKIGFEDHLIGTEGTSYSYLNLKDLKRGYDYEAKIQAGTDGYSGEPLKFAFKAPSGSEF